MDYKSASPEEREAFRRRIEDGPSPTKYEIDHARSTVNVPVTPFGKEGTLYDYEKLTDNELERDNENSNS